MENAAKALLMAGGILISIIIIGILTMMFNAMSNIPKEQEELRAIQKIKEFNDGYLVYERERIYGANIITVLSKALDYNIYCEKNGEEADKIDIIIIFNKDISSWAKEYRYTSGYLNTINYDSTEYKVYNLSDSVNGERNVGLLFSKRRIL